MVTLDAKLFGQRLEAARKSAGLTQAALARAAGVHRLQIVRMEAGATAPRLDETLRLAESLRVPLEYLTDGRFTPTHDLRGIALELYRLGIRDLVVANPRVPGTFRDKEELLALAVSGDRPEPRVIEAIPYLLLRRHFLTGLVTAFADVFDKRARARLAWLSEITLGLNQLSTMPLLPFGSSPTGGRSTPVTLIELIDAGKKATEPDSLGHPGTGNLSPIWRRWNITYAGRLDDFLRRTLEVHAAFEATRSEGFHDPFDSVPSGRM